MFEESTFHFPQLLYYSSPRRVDEDCISPDVKNSIHVGDRILEINGTPIHNVPLDEVFITQSQTHCSNAEILHWKLANRNYDLLKVDLVEEGNVTLFIKICQKICSVLLLFVLNGLHNRAVLFSLGHFV